MAFVLVRIDDRLIHGQVSMAWGAALEPDRIVLANDDVASTEWKCDLYCDFDALGAAISVLSLDGFLEAVREGRWADERVLLVVGSPRDLLALLDGGLDVPEANVGGLHGETKREILPYVFVDDDDVRALLEIQGRGTKLTAQDVPQSRGIDLAPLLGNAA